MARFMIGAGSRVLQVEFTREDGITVSVGTWADDGPDDDGPPRPPLGFRGGGE